jgi:hypothetical protein
MEKVKVWKRILKKGKKFVLFSNDTIVVTDSEDRAKDLMKKFGPACPGTASADFSVTNLGIVDGWVVMYNRPEILTYVSPDEVKEGAFDMMVGLIGRTKREKDGEELKVIYTSEN